MHAHTGKKRREPSPTQTPQIDMANVVNFFDVPLSTKAEFALLSKGHLSFCPKPTFPVAE